MDLVISAILFAAFVPGVVAVVPSHSSKCIVLIVHSLLFAVVFGYVMAYREGMGNYGHVCPNGYVEGPNQKGEKDCVPVGAKTYAV